MTPEHFEQSVAVRRMLDGLHQAATLEAAFYMMRRERFLALGEWTDEPEERRRFVASMNRLAAEHPDVITLAFEHVMCLAEEEHVHL